MEKFSGRCLWERRRKIEKTQQQNSHKKGKRKGKIINERRLFNYEKKLLGRGGIATGPARGARLRRGRREQGNKIRKKNSTEQGKSSIWWGDGSNRQRRFKIILRKQNNKNTGTVLF